MADTPQPWAKPCPGGGTSPGVLGWMEGLLPSGGHARGLSPVGRVASTQAARDSTQALASWPDDLSRTPCSWNASRDGSPDRRQQPPVVAEFALPAQRRSSDPLLRRVGLALARRVTSTFRTAGCGPACPVVWEGIGRGNSGRPYPDRWETVGKGGSWGVVEGELREGVPMRRGDQTQGARWARFGSR